MHRDKRDYERARRNRQALSEAGIDGLVCALPVNVLLLTGYWPVVGTSLAICTRDEQVLLLVPEDELALARRGWADEIVTYAAGSLDDLKSITEIVTSELSKIAAGLGIRSIGFENDAVSLPVPYAAVTVFGWSMSKILNGSFPKGQLVPAGNMLARLRSVLTPDEIGRVRIACRIAEDAYLNGRQEIMPDLSEIEVAKAFREGLVPVELPDGARRDGFMFCMSGKNSYLASAAFQFTGRRRLREHDLVLVHCNSYADGFWTDITRTYCIGDPDRRQHEMFEAVFLARDTALDAIAPGVRAADVDARAREVLADRGFGKYFKHGLGHSVGFAAIDHNASPRLHPASSDTLETGMVFNIEPAIYIEDLGGIRHCDMAAVTGAGAELLTPFQKGRESAVIHR
jgi:Xaa-Pro dipeptidase